MDGRTGRVEERHAQRPAELRTRLQRGRRRGAPEAYRLAAGLRQVIEAAGAE
ncbi:hypothetical protein [Streptomyces sp. AHA2]|uniref:hypothetical protein n=1 Tax=Streptomyces sp. AHA2 TaxID=3064526 RepID=UPI003FA760FF